MFPAYVCMSIYTGRYMYVSSFKNTQKAAENHDPSPSSPVTGHRSPPYRRLSYLRPDTYKEQSFIQDQRTNCRPKRKKKKHKKKKPPEKLRPGKGPHVRICVPLLARISCMMRRGISFHPCPRTPSLVVTVQCIRLEQKNKILIIIKQHGVRDREGIGAKQTLEIRFIRL